ncbi:MAG: hypothetical protein HQL97_17125 [Magnetococcales bacterium]|nr:hypothetical protein [Magnetococcales bacterium]
MTENPFIECNSPIDTIGRVRNVLTMVRDIVGVDGFHDNIDSRTPDAAKGLFWTLVGVEDALNYAVALMRKSHDTQG